MTMMSRGHNDRQVNPAHLSNRKGIALGLNSWKGACQDQTAGEACTGPVQGWTSLDLV